MTAIDTNSKADTRFLSYYPAASSANLATDWSQYRTDLTDGTTYCSEGSSARTALVTPERTLELKFTHTAGGSGILLNHGTTDGVSYTYRVDVNKDSLRFLANGSAIASIELNTTGSKAWVVRWATRASGSSYLSECDAYNATDGAWSSASVTHSAHTTDVAWQFNVGGRGAGVSVYSAGVTAITMVRVSTRYHSRSECAEDWIATSTPDAQTGTTRCGNLPVASSTDLGSHGAFAGPALLIAGDATRNNDRRLLGPVLNLAVSANNELTASYAPTPMVRKAIGSSTYRWRIDLCWQAPCHPAATHARVRLHVKHTQTAGSPLPVYFRMYSLNRLPQIQKVQLEPQPPIVQHYAGGSINTTHTGNGEWIDLGTLTLSRLGPDLMTYLLLAWDVNHDAGAIDEPSQVVHLNRVTVDPFTKPAGSGKFGGFDLELG